MPFAAGARLGTYEILGLIGAGGMGEVYRARDTRLKREVAIKVLPDAFALDPDRVSRFQREAELLATLNHPNIAAIYGFEESASDAARIQALVLELVDGPTLADRLRNGAIPIDEALTIAKQIFYRSADKLMAVDVSMSPDVVLSRPHMLFEQRYAFGAGITIPNYDVSRGGQRFVMIKASPGQP